MPPESRFAQDGLAGMVIGRGICHACARDKDGTQQRCDAFPDGIPAEILNGTLDHRVPQAGDHGLRFKPRATP